MSVRIITAISVLALLSACSTTQENPHYQQNTKYKVHSPNSVTTQTPVTYATYSGGTSTAQTTRAYNTTTTSPSGITHVYQASAPTYSEKSTMVNHECLDKEGNRKLIGTGVGGAAGAFAGHELIGGTKGTILGAVVGGAAGYGIADKTIRCDPIPTVTEITPETTYVEPASYATTTTAYDYDAGYQAGYQAASTEVRPVTTTDSAPATVLSDQTAPTDSAYGDTFGTPGYHAMQANGELGDTTTASSTVSIPAQQPITAPSYSYPQTTTQPTYPQTAQITPQSPTQSLNSTSIQGITMHKVVEGDTVYSLSRELCVGVEDIRNLNSLDGDFSIKLDDHIKLPASRC